MTNSRIDLGKAGEDEAVSFLNKQGFKILERNYRCCYGEIDIIAVEKGTIVFAEVKTRKTLTYGLPQAAVDFRKQRQLSKIAAHYIAEKRLKNTPARFDVVGISLLENETKIELIRNAFEMCL
ncbi:MAG: YraN family protein [Deltaproteobacteria bacterium]|nr:YraN family protein [Deltaproteobacteria bacterium]